jgi:hypothetical protein
MTKLNAQRWMVDRQLPSVFAIYESAASRQVAALNHHGDDVRKI